MARVIFNEDHPCHGKSCSDCETCMFDEPIPDRSLNILPRCTDCGYLIKSYNSKEGIRVYDALCSKHMIVTGSVERARTIQRNVANKDGIVYRPDWCPKVATADPKPILSLPAPTKPVTYDDYFEKRNKMKELPPMMDWHTLKAGDMCVVPRILRQKRKVLLIKEKTDYVLKCVELNEKFEPTSTFTNIYSNDIDVNFIVKLHKF